MKAALVSATSLAALLAFEVGLDVAIDARPAKAASFTAENPTLSFGNLGFVLLNTSGSTTATAGETVTNAHGFTNTITFPGVASPFIGPSPSSIGVGANSSGIATYTVSFAAGTTVSTTASLKTTLTAGAGNTAVVTLTAEAVAPQASIVVNPVYARLGAGAQTIAAITVSNAGNGDLFSNTSLPAQLHGSLGTPSGSVFTLSGSNTYSLNDSHYTGTGTTTATFNYIYTPASRTAVNASLTVSLANGGGTTNASTTSVVTLTGQGVGPAFGSTIGSATYSNGTAVAGTTTTAGTISTGTKAAHATSTLTITLTNASTDPGSASLTDLTLESFSLTGANAGDFSVTGFTTNQVLAEGNLVDLTLDFSGPTNGSYTADLNFTTDEGAALGGAGATFTYILSASVPEPTTVLTFGMGLAGLGWARRRRAARRAAATA